MEKTREAGQGAREEIAQFVQLFPQVKAQEVPEEVWRQVREGCSLALAYCLWRIETLEEELKRKRSDALSTGSVSSAGNGGSQGTLAAFWDAYQV